MSRNIVWAALLFLLLFSAASGRAEEKWVIAEGKAALAHLSMEKAREKALENAFRAAVEENLGLQISSESLTQNYRLISDRILAIANGFISEYKILGERQEEEFYLVKISASVKDSEIRSDLQAIGLLLERKNLPRLVVLIQEKLISRNGQDPIIIELSQVETNVASTFMEKGFYVLDSTALKDSREREQALKALQGDKKAAAILARLTQADILILGQATSQQGGYIGESKLLTTSTTLSLRVVDGWTAEMLAARSWNAPGAGVDELSASAESAKNVSRKVCADLIGDVLDRWVRETGGTQIVQVQVSGIGTLADLEKIESILKNKIQGIKELYRRSFVSGNAIIDIRSRDDASKLAAVMDQLETESIKIGIEGVSQNLIRLKIEKSKQK